MLLRAKLKEVQEMLDQERLNGSKNIAMVASQAELEDMQSKLRDLQDVNDSLMT